MSHKNKAKTYLMILMLIYKYRAYFHFVIISETAVHVCRIACARTVDITVWYMQYEMICSF